MADPRDPDDTFPPDAGSPEPPGSPGTVGFVADVVRKAVLTGVGALFLTEEGARKVAREWKLPKELASYLVGQAQGARDEVLGVVAREMRRFLESEVFRRELFHLLESMTLEVQAEIRLKEADPSKAPSPVRVNVKRRSAGKGHKERAAAGKGGGEKGGA
jgi:hypothetical protein